MLDKHRKMESLLFIYFITLVEPNKKYEVFITNYESYDFMIYLMQQKISFALVSRANSDGGNVGIYQ